MVLDIVVVALIVGTMIQGYRHGFLQTFLHTIGWIIALVSGFIWSPRFKEFVIETTDFYDTFYNNINEKVGTTLSPSHMQGNLPTIMHDSISNISETVSDSISGSLTDLLFTIVCFLIVSLAVQAGLHLFISLFSKEHHDGIRGFLDGLTGMLLGFVKGVVYVFVILALMVPVASLAEPHVMVYIMENLAESKVATELYNNNLLLLIIDDLF